MQIEPESEKTLFINQLTGETVSAPPTQPAQGTDNGTAAGAAAPAPEPELEPAAESTAPEPEPEPAARSKLPDGWEEKKSSSTGGTYYLNTLSGESTWDRPTDAATAGTEKPTAATKTSSAQGDLPVAAQKVPLRPLSLQRP